MTPHKTTVFLSFLSLCLLSLAGMFLHAAYRVQTQVPMLEGNMALVHDLGLTDLCIFTEARYTRNPAVTDRNSAFQDYPLSLEHFPSGGIIGPPPHLIDRTEATGALD